MGADDAAHHLHHARTRHRPGLPAPEASGPSPVRRAILWHGSRVLPGGQRAPLHCGVAARGGPRGVGPRPAGFGSGRAGWRPSGASPCGSSPSAWRVSSVSCVASPSVACMSASSGSSPWRASPSTPACRPSSGDAGLPLAPRPATRLGATEHLSTGAETGWRAGGGRSPARASPPARQAGEAADVGHAAAPFDAYQTVARLQALVRQRAAVDETLRRCCLLVKRSGAFRLAGYPSFNAWASEDLGLPPRTVRHLVHLQQALDAHPQLAAAVRAGTLTSTSTTSGGSPMAASARRGTWCGVRQPPPPLHPWWHGGGVRLGAREAALVCWRPGGGPGAGAGLPPRPASLGAALGGAGGRGAGPCGAASAGSGGTSSTRPADRGDACLNTSPG